MKARGMHKDMQTDLGFKTLYFSADGRAIVEVIHEVSKKAEDRAHPSSYMAFVNLDEAIPLSTGEIAAMHRTSETRVSGNSHIYRKLAALWRGEAAYTKYFTAYSGLSTEPSMGFYYDTEWAARIALEVGEDPFNLHLAVEKVAREERDAKGRELARSHRSKHFGELAKAIEESRARGKLPVNTKTFVEELGGGLQALAVHFNRQEGYGYEDLYVWLTDFEGAMIGIYDGSDEDDEGSVITVKSEGGFENPNTVKGVVETLEGLVKFGRLHMKLF